MSRMEGWLGGSPLGVLAKLLFLSLVVGVLLAAFGLTPVDLVYNLRNTLENLFGFGLDAVRDFGRYVVMGALIVVPIWLVTRLFSRR